MHAANLARLSGRRPQVDATRVPPGQYVTSDFPVLSAGPTPRTPLDRIEELPAAQRVVVTMRDVAGCSAEEVCGTLDVSEGNQRVLLHRSRSRVQTALERHLDG